MTSPDAGGALHYVYVVLLRWCVYPRDQSLILVDVCMCKFCAYHWVMCFRTCKGHSTQGWVVMCDMVGEISKCVYFNKTCILSMPTHISLRIL